MMITRSQREDTFLSSAFLFITSRAPEGSVKSIQIDCLFQSLRLHDVGMYSRARTDRANATIDAALVNIHDEVQIEAADRFVTKRDHFAKFPPGIYMQ